MTVEERTWLEILPVGREFGSKHYERFAKLDALAELATAAARRMSVSIYQTVQFVAESNARIRAMEKPN